MDRTTDEHGVFRDTGQPDGLRLAKYDSDALISEIRDVYGAMDAEGDVLVVIDVVSSPGVPEQRWIYATRKIFLEIDPPTLHLLSLGLLVPDMKRYRVHFTNGPDSASLITRRRRRDDSCPSDEVVGGLFSDFEAIRTE